MKSLISQLNLLSFPPILCVSLPSISICCVHDEIVEISNYQSLPTDYLFEYALRCFLNSQKMFPFALVLPVFFQQSPSPPLFQSDKILHDCAL
jgi:hypothetical protein